MSRSFDKSALEHYIESFTRQRGGKSRQGENRAFLKKALVIIQESIRPTCCDTDNGTVNYHTPRENELTTSVRNFITSQRRNKASMIRAEKLMKNYIYGACCTIPDESDTFTVMVFEVNGIPTTFNNNLISIN